MIIHIEKREDPFVRIDKKAVEDRRLSWKARGLLAYLLSKPPSWNVSVKQLMAAASDGRDSLQSGLQELRKFGYAHYKDSAKGSEWTILESPSFDPNYKRDEDKKEKRREYFKALKAQREAEAAGRKPVCGKPAHLITNIGGSENEEEIPYYDEKVKKMFDELRKKTFPQQPKTKR